MRWLPSFLVGCLIHAFYVLGGKTACRVPFVREWEQTNLTCYFPEDVSKSKKDIAVYHYNENKEKKQDVVGECLWTEGILKCFSLAGYILDKNISDMMTVQLLRVTRNQTGKYACGLHGLKSDDFNLCELYLPSDK